MVAAGTAIVTPRLRRAIVNRVGAVLSVIRSLAPMIATNMGCALVALASASRSALATGVSTGVVRTIAQVMGIASPVVVSALATTEVTLATRWSTPGP